MKTLQPYFLVCLLYFTCATLAAQSRALCNPHATPATKQVYQILCDQYGQKTISGTVARVDWNTDEAEYVRAWTGQ